MKRILPAILLIASVCFSSQSFAQTQKGNMMAGAGLANIGGTFQDGGSYFNLNLTPKLGWFIKDDIAIGADVKLGLRTGEGVTDFNYGVGAFGRYYIKDKRIEVLNRARWFIEANVGVEGINRKTGQASTNTNGLGLGFGPGIAYFITENIGLEASLKYNATLGFGNSLAAHNVGLNVGFQIYLPNKEAKSILNEERRRR